jgi:hypothetical protein
MNIASFSLADGPSNLSAAPPCPTNQRVGPKLDTLTVKALLAVPLTAVSSDETYRFCPAPDCPTAFYRADGQQIFTENELRERVYQKHADDPQSVICYCFGHTVGDIQAELGQRSASTIVERIQAGIQAGQCACDIRNPQGHCCLGNVRDLIDRLSAPLPHKEARDV